MTFDPRENYDDSRLCLTASGEFQDIGVDACCSPESEGYTHFPDGEVVGVGSSQEKYGAPFNIDIVLGTNTYPQDGEIQQIRDELGTEFANQFDYAEIKDSDKPVETILNLDGVGE